MRQLNIMLKPASSMCNLRCKYCFYADVSANRKVKSYGVMTDETAESLIRNVFIEMNDGDAVKFVFQGGEPTLAGVKWFRQFTEYVRSQKRKVNVSYALQTNAMLLNEEWCLFLKENDFLVGVSLDGPENNHNLCREDAEGKSTYRDVMAAIQLLNKYHVEYNVLMTLTNNLARHPNQVWKLITDNNFRFVQFTPCVSDFDDSSSVFALAPDRFASFYIQIFGLWKKAFEKDNYYSIKLIDDLVNLYAFGEVNACGLVGECNPQIVVEADGSAYPCDFYMTDEWETGNLAKQPISQIMNAPNNYRFISRPRSQSLCETCNYREICNGGCRRMQRQVCYGDDSIRCGYRRFLDAVDKDLREIAETQRIYRNSTRSKP